MLANGDGERQPAQQGLRDFAQQLWGVLQRSLFRQRVAVSAAVPLALSLPKHYEPLRRALLTDGVGRTLFEEYAVHREAENGDEETGWVLMGLRERDEAIALATLPAGTQRDAGIAHVRFNSSGQALASRVRQHNSPVLISDNDGLRGSREDSLENPRI